jgi:hypothetical protein
MRRTILASLFALATALVGAEARAAGDWGLHSGDTLRGGDFMPYGEAGWPDVTLGLQYGLTERVDLGARLSLLYSWEHSTATNVGFGFRVPIRISLTKRSRFSALIHVDPGIKVYGDGYYNYDFYDPPPGRPIDNKQAVFGLQFPFGVELGIHITPDATIQIGADVPMTVLFSQTATFVTGPLTGFGFEFHVDDHLGIGLNSRFGPVIFVHDGSVATFGFLAQLGLMYRI